MALRCCLTYTARLFVVRVETLLRLPTFGYRQPPPTRFAVLADVVVDFRLTRLMVGSIVVCSHYLIYRFVITQPVLIHWCCWGSSASHCRRLWVLLFPGSRSTSTPGVNPLLRLLLCHCCLFLPQLVETLALGYIVVAVEHTCPVRLHTGTCYIAAPLRFLVTQPRAPPLHLPHTRIPLRATRCLHHHPFQLFTRHGSFSIPVTCATP